MKLFSRLEDIFKTWRYFQGSKLLKVWIYLQSLKLSPNPMLLLKLLEKLIVFFCTPSKSLMVRPTCQVQPESEVLSYSSTYTICTAIKFKQTICEFINTFNERSTHFENYVNRRYASLCCCEFLQQLWSKSDSLYICIEVFNGWGCLMFGKFIIQQLYYWWYVSYLGLLCV